MMFKCETVLLTVWKQYLTPSFHFKFIYLLVSDRDLVVMHTNMQHKMYSSRVSSGVSSCK